MTEADRRAAVKTMSRDELAQVMKATPPDVLVGIGKKSLAALGTYKMRLVKQERVNGKLLDAQEMVAYIRESPYAARVSYVKGPAAGRRLVYNSDLRKDELRVREAGLLGIAGAVWLSVDSSLAKNDSNHTVTELGFGKLLGYFERDFKRGGAGFEQRHEGFDESGAFCTLFVAPKGITGFYAQQTRICTDLPLGLPVLVEAYDGKGLLERFRFSDVSGPLQLDGEFFTPAKAGL
jgi:hypothetical protein